VTSRPMAWDFSDEESTEVDAETMVVDEPPPRPRRPTLPIIQLPSKIVLRLP
jgi:hypothetical protein